MKKERPITKQNDLPLIVRNILKESISKYSNIRQQNRNSYIKNNNRLKSILSARNQCNAFEIAIENQANITIHHALQYKTPKGNYHYPIQSQILARDKFSIEYMGLIEGYKNFYDTVYNIEPKFGYKFVKFPQNKTQKERIQNEGFILYCFYSILHHLLNFDYEGNHSKLLDISLIIRFISSYLNKSYKVIYELITNSLKQYKSKAKAGPISRIRDLRHYFCNICYKYLCNYHFKARSKVVYSKNLEFLFLRSHVIKTSLSKTFSGNKIKMLVDLSDSRKSSSDDTIVEKCCENRQCEILPLNLNEVFQIFRLEDFYLLIMLIRSVKSPCYIAKDVFNGKYSCDAISAVLEQSGLEGFSSTVNLFFKQNSTIQKLYPIQSDYLVSDIVEYIEETDDTCKNQQQPSVNHQYILTREKREFVPCSHSGTCTEDNCPCINRQGVCEKFCDCYPKCASSHKGCKCQNACISNCPCDKDYRECDPDICSCKCDGGECSNSQIFENRPKRTAVGMSYVCESFGLFALERIKKGEFVCEYQGEIIAKEETKRRSTYNYTLGLNYFFKLSDLFDIDAFRLGNEMRFVYLFRFINHSSFGYENCKAKTKYVNGRVRIGLFALRDIEVNEEIFFNYRIKEKVDWFTGYNRIYSNKRSSA